MRRWIVKSFGEPKDVWTLQDNAASLEPGPGQVKVKVEACGLGLPDVLMCRDNYPMTPPLPFTPSQEAAGEIIATGEGVDEALIGTRVVGPTLFLEQAGGLADECLMAVPGLDDGVSSGLLLIPDEMTGIEAAGLYIPYQTAWVALVRRAKITKYDVVLVLGASGSSGNAAVQLAKARGARVIAVAGGPEKAAFCKSIGADEVIDRKQQDITEAALQLTDGKGVSIVFDPVGGKAARAAFEATAFEGRFIFIGYASGEWPSIAPQEAVMRNISLVGAMPMGFSANDVLAIHQNLVKHWQEGAIDVSNNQVFDFADAPTAATHIADGKVEGKVIVQINVKQS
ncbi:NADPH2:quinone reductase [Pseudomonas pohangensis]|uniref:NADPH2:quinone reductase n=1 Tax=Pseudomonas pohangensis TaxID=364197 RepID=A0A1H2FMC0_9PSED|nr:NADPH:quinone oxidoreductase family protein [Pseudomonas pohangensis]SDU08510.1 NADPH2:quinone reductase [Pseudomonas pohangensis]